MVGLVVVTHGALADAFLAVVRGILGPVEVCGAVGFRPEVGVDSWTQAIEDEIVRLDDGDGVLILADMFGGSPCNVSLRQLGQHSVEVVTGVNLPMILGVLSSREGKGLTALAALAQDSGVSGVMVATDILRSRLET